MRYLITYSYDGTNFFGYQFQEGLRTVEGELLRALKYINNKQDTKVFSSGRTDKGVHAKCQKAHFDLSVSITPYKLKCALNSNLPNDIHVIDAVEVDDNFHARYMVLEKTYRYYLNMGEYNPLERNYVYQYCNNLDIVLMQDAIKCFIGTHNFKSWTPNKDKRNNYVRTIKRAYIEQMGDVIVFTFSADGFLKYQIRNMVGYLIRVGEHKKSKNDIEYILSKMDRRFASITAHPEGLCLEDVVYKNV